MGKRKMLLQTPKYPCPNCKKKIGLGREQCPYCKTLLIEIKQPSNFYYLYRRVNYKGAV